jgi:HK97 family phage major capsid protein
VFAANHRDADVQKVGKGLLSDLHAKARSLDGDAAQYQSPQGIPTGQGIYRGDGKSTLGTTDATGGWIIPNAIVDEFITPATVDNIYRTICTVVPGVTAASVDIPFRSAARARAGIIAFGNTKTNIDLAYNGYTATMYTLAAIYDIGNQFLRQSRGAAEQDVLSELAAAFAQGEAYYVREGSGSSQPFGYTSALTNGPAAFRSTFTPSATTLAGSMATAIATAAGALAGRGVAGRSGQGLSAVLSATSYWTMLAQGTDSAGFFFNPSQGPTAINAPAGTLISPFGIPVYPDADADLEGTAAVIDNLVVGNWKKFKLYFGQSYRVDSSEEAGTRWDTNLTGFRGEEEMGFDARPAVYAGHFQLITDIVP